MSFINGLKRLFKTPIYILIIISFVISWFLILFGSTFLPIESFTRFIIIFVAVLFGFSLFLFIMSFFKPLNELNKILILIAFILGIPLIFLFDEIVSIFFTFCIYANLILTAFFAFKICMDFSLKIDDYLYQKEKYRQILRIIEFITFGVVYWLIYRLSTNFFLELLGPSALVIWVLRIIFWIDLILIGVVLLTILFAKRYAAFITLFFSLSFFYIIYIFLDVFSELIFTDTSVYQITSFILDLIIFLYIIGSIFDKVDYLKDALKVFRADTIALFVIIMKLVVQITKIFPYIPGVDVPPDVRQELWILLIFLTFTLFFGIYKIISKRKDKSTN
ncbi:MAG: hypothetical protein GF317_05270 [Candidatus Lokiarchaeota archaeon]|nr:hypothetical protein [Candidatus Lokiarchaeota archaeon]MBD3199217.1 hypothetical protein [Candidatus Lokiarchaeota archaeon]